METGIKLATEQAFGFLLGILVVSVVQPETTGGAILLILISVAIYNVILQFAKCFWSSRGGAAAEKTIKGNPKSTLNDKPTKGRRRHRRSL